MFTPIVSPGRDPEPVVSTAQSPGAASPRSFFTAMGGFATGGLGLGASARLGTTFGNHVSVAASVTYESGAPSSAVAGTFAYLYMGGELGVDAAVGPIVLRTYVGLGGGTVTSSTLAVLGPMEGASSGESTAARFDAWLGLQTTFDVPGTPLFVAGDVRVLDLPSLAVFAGAGVRFGR